MSKQLYEEALADAKKLKEIAEDNAKRALVEAVTPRIRDLIEKELLREFNEEEELESEAFGAPGAPELPGQLMTDMIVEPGEEDAIDPDAIFVGDYGVPVEQPVFGRPLPPEDEDGVYELNLESVSALAPIAKSSGTKNIGIVIARLGEHLQMLKQTAPALQNTHEFAQQMTKMLEQIDNTYAYVQESMVDPGEKNVYENKLENYFSQLTKLQENNKMRSRNKMLNEADVTLKLTGLPDDLDLETLGVDLISGDEGEEEGEEGGDEELDLDMGDEGAEGEEEGGDEELELDMGGDEEGGEEEEEEATQMESRRLRDNLVVEIDERMLVREISRMRAIREANETKPYKGPGPGHFDSFGDGKDDGDPWLDAELTLEVDEVDEGDDQLAEYDLAEDDDVVEGNKKHPGYRKTHPAEQANRQANLPEALRRELALQTEAKKKAMEAKKKKELAEKKKKKAKSKKEAASCMKEAHQLQEAYEFYADKYHASVERANKIKSRLAESARSERTNNGGSIRSAGETANLRNKLAETNLYNAKLLYTNRLLQNESLSKRQKAEIIERLDEAANIREVKLVYESLSKTLEGTSRPLSESTERKVLGSSSRATRPASTNLTEGYETDRWSRLAGITK